MIRVKFFLICFAIAGVLSPLCPVRETSAWSPRFFQETMPGLSEIELEPVVDGLDQPLFLTGAKDGTRRLFIVERTGRIKMLQPGDSSPAVFLDISAKIRTGGENGLLGLAFHPDYRENRRFFITYTRGSDGATVLAEYRALESNPSVAQTDERLVTLIPQPSDIHHGGMIAFGADNFLYLSTGDGNWEDPDSSAQNIEELRGKILRIDIDNTDGETTYLSPASNPFSGERAGRDEIYALGFRNPWRFSIDRQTGELYVGDVGHDHMEEINIVTAGGNYGWRIFEGTNCAPFEPALCGVLQTNPPVVEYEHIQGRCSVTGGYVYRGNRSTLPAGAYMFGDFCTGEIFLMSGNATHVLLDTDHLITSFGEDDDGELYVVGLRGTVHRIKQAAVESQVRIESVEVRRRSGGQVVNPVRVSRKGKKFEVVARGSGFAAGAVVVVGGREMETRAGASANELIARLRSGTLAAPGPLTIEVVNPDQTRAEIFVIEVLD